MNMDTTNKSPTMVLSDAYQYPLELWDLLVMVTLNPLKTDLTKITLEKALALCAQLEIEELNLQLLIKTQVFNLGSRNEIELLVRRYHSSLIILLDYGLDGQQNSTVKSVPVKNLYKCVLKSIDALLSFLENRFSEFLGMEIRAPSTFLAVSQLELRKRVDKLKVKKERFGIDDPALELVLSSLHHFINIPKGDNQVTFATVLYHKDLVHELEKVNCMEKSDSGFSKIDELLILMNYNSKHFAKHLMDSITQKMTQYKRIIEKIDALHFYKKAFSQIHGKPGMIFNPYYTDLEKMIGRWFEEEIGYMEKKLKWTSLGLKIPTDQLKTTNVQQANEKLKVQVNLSSDQTGLILRAADDARVLVSKSLNEVFKTIVPHLATPHKENLSYGGMRTQAYVAEKRDKDIAINALEKIITKIREY